jgi:hypothetical protein
MDIRNTDTAVVFIDPQNDVLSEKGANWGAVGASVTENRTVAFVLAGNMAVAYFMVHAPRGFFPLLNGGELAIVYCFVFLYFWLAGGGPWSLDRVRTASAASPSRA